MSLKDQGEEAALTMELRAVLGEAVLGENTKIVVGEQGFYGQDLWNYTVSE